MTAVPAPFAPDAFETEQITIRCAIMRGGTSKGVFFLEGDLPPAGPLRDRLLKRVMGTPDLMQIDGLGGTHLVTSKIAIVARSTDPDADVDYTFAQAEIGRDVIDYSGNCGNISSAVGPFAIDAGLVPAAGPVTPVRIRNTNTGRLLVAHVPVRGGRAQIGGDYAIPGVPGTGAEIFMDYSDTIGAKTGRMLPTGQARETMTLADGRSLDVTICDVANPSVFVAAADVGLVGDELPSAFDGNPDLLATLREIRGRAAERLGFASDWRAVDDVSPFLPFVVLVAPPRAYRSVGGEAVAPDAADLLARMIFMNRCHGSMAGTTSMCIAAAARIGDSVVGRVLQVGSRNSSLLRIGHPAGVMHVEAACEADAGAEGGVRIARLGFSRTARKIMDGFTYVPRRDLAFDRPP